jgi:hypothetical protein
MSTAEEVVAVPSTHEGSAWMREAVATRLQEAATRLPFLQPGTVVVSGITGSLAMPGAPADYKCDRCEDPDARLYLFRHGFQLDGITVLLVGGLCYTCATAEGWKVVRDEQR